MRCVLASASIVSDTDLPRVIEDAIRIAYSLALAEELISARVLPPPAPFNPQPVEGLS